MRWRSPTATVFIAPNDTAPAELQSVIDNFLIGQKDRKLHSCLIKLAPDEKFYGFGSANSA
jgi:hypothetical protein